jgi:hypothetical protein
MLRIISIIFLFVSAELCFAATTPDEGAVVPATGQHAPLPISLGVPTISDEEIERVEHHMTSAPDSFKVPCGVVGSTLKSLTRHTGSFHETERDIVKTSLLLMVSVGIPFAIEYPAEKEVDIFKACQYILYIFLEKNGKNPKKSGILIFTKEELQKIPCFKSATSGLFLGWLYGDQFGLLPFVKEYQEPCQNMLISQTPYVKKEGRLFLKKQKEVSQIFFAYDLEANSVVDDPGFILTLIPHPHEKKWVENIRWRHRGGIAEYTNIFFDGNFVMEFTERAATRKGIRGESLAHKLLGDDYPTEVPIEGASRKDYFIPFPDTTEEREEVYEEVVRELVKDYRSTQDEAERDAILETLVGFGESTRLLEDIPEPVRPEGLSDGQWRKRLNREKGKSEKRQKALETKINNAQQEVARKMAVERALKGRIIEDVPHTEEAAAPVPAEAPVLSSDEERELAILKEIEEANKKAREEKAARKATEKKEGSSGGAGAPVFAGAGAAAGAGTSLSTVDDSNLPKKGRVSFKGIVRMIKDYAKRNGSSVAIDESTGSSHFTVTAEDGTKTTLVRKHGGDTSAPVRIVGKILGKLFGKKEA